MSGGPQIKGEQSMSSALHIKGVPTETRDSLRPILDQSFKGVYRWHAQRTLRSVKWVREATQGDTQVGLTMFTMLEQSSGYIYYIAVTPSQRAKGVGGFLLDDALQLLRTSGALEIIACVRTDNIPSIRLLQSRDFVRTGFRELVLLKGFASAARLWMRMVVAPGEKVFIRVLRS
ncbi:MAG: GNAT family N-acetyltransferase [Spirochaetia bacterium]|jgi:ribosomal protein S18 acetylase RimI-like enzyme